MKFLNVNGKVLINPSNEGLTTASIIEVSECGSLDYKGFYHQVGIFNNNPIYYCSLCGVSGHLFWDPADSAWIIVNVDPRFNSWAMKYRLNGHTHPGIRHGEVWDYEVSYGPGCRTIYWDKGMEYSSSSSSSSSNSSSSSSSSESISSSSSAGMPIEEDCSLFGSGCAGTACATMYYPADNCTEFLAAIGSSPSDCDNPSCGVSGLTFCGYMCKLEYDYGPGNRLFSGGTCCR